MSINVFKAKYQIDECLEEIRDCLEIGWTGMGFKTSQFENAWKEYTGYKNAYFVNSSTAGLFLSVDILKEEKKWKDGDEIITTPITFVSLTTIFSFIPLLSPGLYDLHVCLLRHVHTFPAKGWVFTLLYES